MASVIWTSPSIFVKRQSINRLLHTSNFDRLLYTFSFGNVIGVELFVPLMQWLAARTIVTYACIYRSSLCVQDMGFSLFD